MEIWKDVPGFEQRYQVSNLGRIRSKSYYRTNGYGYYWTKGKILAGFKDHSGYPNIVLKENGRTVRAKVHRLVALAFLPNPENKPEVDHINTIVDDNRVENLRWVTSKENKHNPITRARSLAVKKRTRPVICTCANGDTKRFNSVKEASITLGIDLRHIYEICRGSKIRKTAGGYKWKYDI